MIATTMVSSITPKPASLPRPLWRLCLDRERATTLNIAINTLCRYSTSRRRLETDYLPARDRYRPLHLATRAIANAGPHRHSRGYSLEISDLITQSWHPIVSARMECTDLPT